MPSPPPLPSKGQQQHNTTNGVHSPLVTSAMLNSLMRHLQHNKMFCSAPTAMPTFPAVAQYPSMMSCNVHNIGTNVHEALFCNNSNVQSNEGTTTAAHFAKTVDSLHNFLSPNVVLLPVAFHSLDDEQHVQLIGMPQTVIPIAIHPAMQKQFAVRPLLVDQAMARQQPHDGGNSCSSTTTSSIATLPQHIGIGRVVDNECVFWQQQQHHHQPSEEHFQLPVALRPSLVHYAQNEQKQQQQQQDFLPTECNFHPKNGRQRPSSSVDKVLVVVGDDECKTEPLDLSLTTRTKTNENGVGGIGGVVTEIPLVQRRKRTNKGPTDEMAEKKLGKTTPESVLDDERRPSPTGPITSSSISLCCSSSSAFGPPPPLVVPAFSTTAPSCSSSSPAVVVFTNGTTTTKCSSTAATVSATTTALAAADSSTRKRFLCDLCGDVSFLAQETLIGHQKYYCRNRPRLDDVPEPSCPTNNVVKKLVVVVPNNGINSASTVTAAPHTLSSSAKKAALMNNVQCPFQAVNNESMSAYQKQQQHHSALPVICADCGYRAFTVRGLRTHVRLSHGTNSAEQTAAVNNNKRAVTTNGNGAAEAGERMAALNGRTTKYFEGTAAGGGE